MNEEIKNTEEKMDETQKRNYFLREVYYHEKPMEWVLHFKNEDGTWITFAGKTREAVWVAFLNELNGE